MQTKTKMLTGAVALALAGAVGTTAAVAGGDDGEGTVTGPEARQATEAALEVTGGGTAASVERDTENGATWEVEVARPDGTTVDVRLDERFRLVVVEGDTEGDPGSGSEGADQDD